jgi:hypothetical protein
MAVLLWQRYPDILEYLPMFDDKRPVDWSNDSLRILVRKLLRQLSASRVVVWVLDRAVQVLERGVRRTENYGGKTGIMLRSLYRWINGAYIYRGFQDGLKIYGIPN